MEIHYFIKGIAVGFSIAAPVGPIGVLTIHRSLKHGPSAGLATGLGAATADAVYGCMAGFGITFVSGILLAWNTPILLAGSLVLCAMGLGMLFKSQAQAPGMAQERFTNLPSAFFSAFFLTLTNPMTIMAFTAIFAGLGLAGQFAPRLRPARIWMLPPAGLLLLLAAGGTWASSPSRFRDEAVVVDEHEVTARFEPLPDATEHFSMPGGSVIRITSQSRDWVRIESDGKTGWVRENSVRRLIHPGAS